MRPRILLNIARLSADRDALEQTGYSTESLREAIVGAIRRRADSRADDLDAAQSHASLATRIAHAIWAHEDAKPLRDADVDSGGRDGLR